MTDRHLQAMEAAKKAAAKKAAQELLDAWDILGWHELTDRERKNIRITKATAMEPEDREPTISLSELQKLADKADQLKAKRFADAYRLLADRLAIVDGFHCYQDRIAFNGKGNRDES